MKPKLKKIALLSMLSVISLIFMKCQSEESILDNSQERIKTVTTNEVRDFLKGLKNNSFAKSANNELENLEFDKIAQEKINGSDQLLTVIPFSTNNDFENDRLLLLKIDNEIKSVIFKMYPEENSIQGSFSGKLFVYSTDGKFINGFRAKDGFIVSQFFDNDYIVKNKATGKSAVQLKEVVVQNNYRNTVHALDVFGVDGMFVDFGGNDTYYSWDAGRGAYDVPQTVVDPCDKIKLLKSNANFLAKQEELRKKTNLKVESGYMQSKNGPFTAITETSSTENTDQLKFQSDANTIGYMHTHLDDYERKKSNGDTESVKPIKIFSPEDTKQFLILLLSANKNNIPIDDVYGTVISSKGTYQLRFTGNINDVSAIGNTINWESLNEIYKEVMKRNSIEKGFLKFLNEQIGINGIELYKIDASGNSKKTLDNTGKIITANCK